jgi:hypothetical protein
VTRLGGRRAALERCSSNAGGVRNGAAVHARFVPRGLGDAECEAWCAAERRALPAGAMVTFVRFVASAAVGGAAKTPQKTKHTFTVTALRG